MGTAHELKLYIKNTVTIRYAIEFVYDCDGKTLTLKDVRGKVMKMIEKEFDKVQDKLRQAGFKVPFVHLDNIYIADYDINKNENTTYAYGIALIEASISDADIIVPAGIREGTKYELYTYIKEVEK